MRRSVKIYYRFLSVALLVVTFRLSLPYMKIDLSELIQLSFSFIGPVVVLISSILLLKPTWSGAKWINTKWGLLIGGSLFIILQLFVIFMRYQEILDDGMAYWMYVNLPGALLGIPFLLAGSICGWIADTIKNRRLKNQSEATP